MYKVLDINIYRYSYNIVIEFFKNIIKVIKKILFSNNSIRNNTIVNDSIKDFSGIKLEADKFTKNISYSFDNEI